MICLLRRQIKAIKKPPNLRPAASARCTCELSGSKGDEGEFVAGRAMRTAKRNLIYPTGGNLTTAANRLYRTVHQFLVLIVFIAGVQKNS